MSPFVNRVSRARLNKQLNEEDNSAVKKRSRSRTKVLRSVRFSKFKRTVLELRCRRENHKILITKSGKVVLLNHTKEEIRTINIMENLADKRIMCPCIDTLRYWKKNCTNAPTYTPIRLTNEFIMEAERAKQRHKYRRIRNGRAGVYPEFRKMHIPDPFLRPFKSRASVIAKVLQKAMINDCLKPQGHNSYKMLNVKLLVDSYSSHKSPMFYHRYSRIDVKLPAIDALMSTGSSDYVKYGYSLIKPTIRLPNGTQGFIDYIGTAGRSNYRFCHQKAVQQLVLPEDWYDRLYRQGKGVVEGVVITSSSGPFVGSVWNHPNNRFNGYPSTKKMYLPAYNRDDVMLEEVTAKIIANTNGRIYIRPLSTTVIRKYINPVSEEQARWALVDLQNEIKPEC